MECFLDITEQKKTEEALKENEEKFRNIFNHANDAIQVNLFTDGFPGLFIDVNDVACRMLGYTREEMLCLGPQDIPTGFHHPSIETSRKTRSRRTVRPSSGRSIEGRTARPFPWR